MAVITGVDKHIKLRVKPAYEQTEQIPNRFHRGPVSIEVDRIYLDFSALICLGRIHRYNLLYARPLCRRVDRTCQINALIILIVRYKYPPRRYAIESSENSTNPVFSAASVIELLSLHRAIFVTASHYWTGLCTRGNYMTKTVSSLHRSSCSIDGKKTALRIIL